jgi:hypothetical protein
MDVSILPHGLAVNSRHAISTGNAGAWRYRKNKARRVATAGLM